MSRADDREIRGGTEKVLTLEFDDSHVLQTLCGERDHHLATLERRTRVTIAPRGNILTVRGVPERVERACGVLRQIYRRIGQGDGMNPSQIDAALCSAADDGPDPKNVLIHTGHRRIHPRSQGQRTYIEALRDNTVVFALGPAGTGKTYLAVAHAVSLFLAGDIRTIILTRPAVEAGEKLGFLPGDMKDKVDPYLRPLYDALGDTLPRDRILRLIERGDIEIAPLAFMRGRTLRHAFVIFDEAQNATRKQMKMLLTRIGEQCRMAVTGDPSQADLDTAGALEQAVRILRDIKGIADVRFHHEDIVRHPLVEKIVQAYDSSLDSPNSSDSRKGD